MGSSRLPSRFTIHGGQDRASDLAHGLDWVCEVEAEGLSLWQGPSKIYGVDSWHALMLALRTLREILSHEVRQGAVFHWEGGKHAISIDELFVLHEIA